MSAGQVADARKDAIHKLTTGIARTYGTVVIEDLNVAGDPRTGDWPGMSPIVGSPAARPVRGVAR